MGRRSRRSLVLTNSRGDALGPETETQQGQAEQRAEAASRLKLLPMPGQPQEQVCGMLQNRSAYFLSMFVTAAHSG